MRYRAILAGCGVALACLGAERAHAQRTFRTVGNDFLNGAKDMVYVLASPLHADGRDWRDAALVAGGILLVVPADDDVDATLQRHRSSVLVQAVRPFGDSARIQITRVGNATYILPVMGAMYVVGFAFDSRKLRDAAVGCAAAQQANAAVRSLFYEVLSRRRPSTAGGNQYRFRLGGGGWEQHSFFSGHAANFASCAAAWSTRFHLGVAEPVLYATALGVGLARVSDQHHWISDTAVGLTVGYAMGTTLGRRQLRRLRDERGAEKGGTEKRGGLTDGLYAAPGAGGMVLGWRGTF